MRPLSILVLLAVLTGGVGTAFAQPAAGGGSGADEDQVTTESPPSINSSGAMPEPANSVPQGSITGSRVRQGDVINGATTGTPVPSRSGLNGTVSNQR